jgi:hypothetical protein
MPNQGVLYTNAERASSVGWESHVANAESHVATARIMGV